MDKATTTAVARVHGWELLSVDSYTENSQVLNFYRDASADKKSSPMYLSVHTDTDRYNRTRFVDSILYHPRIKAWTSVRRDWVSPDVLESLFKNPREHTGKGRHHWSTLGYRLSRRIKEFNPSTPINNTRPCTTKT